MTARLLYRPDGTLRVGRLVVVLVVTVVLAMFGTSLIWLAPTITDDPWLRTMWVLFAVGALKVPLIVVLWSFIRRNTEWPGRPVKWQDEEVTAILAHLRDRANDAEGRVDRDARLAFLSREAWNVADSVDGARKVDALTVALRIDERLMGVRDREESA